MADYRNIPDIVTVPQDRDGEIVLFQPDENIRLEVLLEDETVWLSQSQMAELFMTTPQNVTLHIGNIYKEEELPRNSTCKESLQVQKEGKRVVRRKQEVVCHYEDERHYSNPIAEQHVKVRKNINDNIT